MCAQQIEAFAQAGQHAEREAIDLEQLHRLEIVLVPLDDRAIRHRRVLDRHERVQRMLGDHEAADVLREMARKSEQLAGQREELAQHAAVRIEAALRAGIARASLPLRMRENMPVS